jgi:hypothetical protein
MAEFSMRAGAGAYVVIALPPSRWRPTAGRKRSRTLTLAEKEGGVSPLPGAGGARMKLLGSFASPDGQRAFCAEVLCEKENTSQL